MRTKIERHSMLYRLRIAASVLCLVVGALLLVLWVRSHRWDDKVAISFIGGRDLTIWHAHGRLSFIIWTPGQTLKPSNEAPFWSRTSRRLSPDRYDPDFLPSSWGFGYLVAPGEALAFVPYWFPAAILAVLAAVLGVRGGCRFSLRNLLLAVTFVAVTFGLAMAIR